MTPIRVWILAATAVAGTLALPACSSSPKADGPRELTPEDFAASSPTPASGTPSGAAPGLSKPGTAAKPATAGQPVPVIAPDAPASNDAASASTPDPGDKAVASMLDRMPKPVIVATTRKAGQDEAYTMDAMVGQVNGQAIYATALFEPIHDQLLALGRARTRLQFRQQARQLIGSRLDQIVTDALILGEAERDLSDQEQQGLQQMLKEERANLVRRYGGTPSLANEELRRTEGKSIDQKITETRQKLIVQKYMRQKLYPKINVTRRDIERYYRDRYADFNPPPGRVLRVIRVAEPSQAQRIDDALASGKPFAQIAGEPSNQYKRDTGGLMEKVVGDEIFDPKPLNQAVLALKIGEHTPRIKVGDNFWWVSLESFDSGQGKPLRDVQLEIEERLKRQRFNALSTQYRARLFNEGSYNPVDEMGDSLLAVALSRYAKPE
ncbi:MAG: peptidyl-prolyl cis-trans isomerase [Planctomycetota bacterium]|nr:peptidyl-prolyl cis-trans isomerase [Planctomycetota bacterium]